MKKTKKKKLKPNKESFNKMFAEIYASRMKDLDVAFDSSVKAISKVFCKYSVQDVAISLFVSNLWLPNIASPIKHQLLTAILVSLKPYEFSDSNVINSYDDFKNLLQVIYSHTPSFEILEDYIPEPDWGSVKFYHEGRNFKIFYGKELSNIYDYLVLYQMLYIPFNEGYYNHTGRSPTKELQYCLKLQDDIISKINSQPSIEILSELSPGRIAIPPQNFWEDAIKFYINYKPEQIFDEIFLKNYSIQSGTWPREHLKCEVFHDMAFCGKVLPTFFILHEDRYFPILPRRYPSILFDSWSKIYEENHSKVINDGMPYSMYVGVELHRYIKARIDSNFLSPLVSAVTTEGKPHEILFPNAFISKDRLILVYVTNPNYSKQKTDEELTKIAPKLNEALKLISKLPVTLALHLDGQNIQFQNESGGKSLKPELFIIVPQVETENLSLSIPKILHGKARFMFMDHFLGIIDELENVEMMASFIEYLEEYDQVIRAPVISPLDKFGSFKSSHGVLIAGAFKFDLISLDPHWGTHIRFETLSEFWKLYPEKHFFDHPRSWKVTRETESRVRLEARGYFGCALYCKIGLTHIFLNSPFDKISYRQAEMANFLMKCLEDTFSRNRNLIVKHKFFQICDQLQVNLFPLSLVLNKDEFRHLKHLIPGGRYWCADCRLTAYGFYGIRVVFDDTVLEKYLISAKDRSLEIEFCLEILGQLNIVIPDTNLVPIRNTLETQKQDKPRFKIRIVNKEVSFPEFINPFEPTIRHFKKAKKRSPSWQKSVILPKGLMHLRMQR